MPAFRETEAPDGAFQAAKRSVKDSRRYNATFSALFRSGRARDFFSRAPLSREALAAELTRLAYVSFAHDGARLQHFLEMVGFRLVGRPYDDGNTQAYLAEGVDMKALVFRGSDDLGAWMTNLRAQPSRWAGEGRVHSGFSGALEKAYPAIEPLLKAGPGKPLLVCGHSLGGALALLAALRVGKAEVYTFGSPRVGNQAFAEAVDRMPGITLRRYVNFRDPVCLLPPSLPDYRHCGTAYYIDKNGSVSSSPSEPVAEDWRELRQLWKTVGGTLQVGLSGRRSATTDHSPINYVTALR